MDKKGNQIFTITRAPQLTERRSFLRTGTLALATLVLSPLFGRGPFAADSTVTSLPRNPPSGRYSESAG